MNTGNLVATEAPAFAVSAAPAHTVSLNDAQIAAIVVTANQVDIDAGKPAESRSDNQEVKSLARQMVQDQGSVNKAAAGLVTKLRTKPEKNATSASFMKNGADILTRLKALREAAFDQAYIDNEVSYHQTVLDALDKTLAPSAKNEELKALPINARPAFVAHLGHARQLQTSLKK